MKSIETNEVAYVLQKQNDVKQVKSWKGHYHSIKCSQVEGRQNGSQILSLGAAFTTY